MRIAGRRDMQAIQLAAEVLSRECTTEQGLAVMHKAIAVATDDGNLSLANHYILRFLADLLRITPTTLETLFQELAGTPLAPPQDPSQDAYWRAHNPVHYRRQAEREAEQARARAQAEQQRRQQEQEREQARQQQADARRDEARAQREREQRRRQERQRQQNDHQQHQHQRHASTPPPDRTLRALAVLGLSRGASRSDIRLAYRRMAQLHHPDRVFSQSEQKIALASQRFQRIKKAYDYLMQRH
jgi:multidrug efflux pump subunit AcrA (membrane-fusion protein)